MSITIHKEEDFKKMHAAGKLAASTLDYVTEFITPGITTNYLNDLCHNYILKHGAKSATLNYKGFPKSICTSINHVVCHGIPSEKKLKNGDILNIDITVILDGWYGDTSKMFFVGDEVSIKAKRLVRATYEAMMYTIDIIKPGITLGDIGYSIETIAKKYNFTTVRDYTGHGIGKVFHSDPPILNYGAPNSGLTIKEGMFFTVEPMLNTGKRDTILSKLDQWTVTTRDKSLSAQFEHSIGVTKNGCEIFTLSPKGWLYPPYN